MAVFKLPRLPIGWEKQPTLYERYWDEAMTKLEETLTAILSIPELADAIQAAQDAADNAQTAADNANTVAATVTSQNNLISSYPDGVTISGADAGTNVTVTINAHTRVYGDASTLSVAGGTVPTLAYSTLYYIYYVDATRADTTPTYLATTDETVAAQTGDTHLVGSVTTPAAAAPPSTGDAVLPPGVGNIL